MVPIGFGLFWVGYALSTWGYFLVRGYNLSPKQIISPVGFYTGKWPPPKAGNTVIIPNGSKADTITTAFTVTNTPGNPLGGGAPSNAAGGVANTATIKQAAEAYGWQSGGQYNALTHIIAAESGGNPHAKNPSSGAYGIAQSLGHPGVCGSESCEYGSYGLTPTEQKEANSGNALQQLRWMMNYIKQTYGDPVNAWSFHLANNSY